MRHVILQFSIVVHRGCTKPLCTILMLTLLIPSAIIAQAQTTVRGRIVDEAGNHLHGVNVMLKGSTLGTNSDENGHYSIKVPGKEAVLAFSFIGYTTKEVVVGSQSVIDVSLAPNAESLSEVVVVGYGT